MDILNSIKGFFGINQSEAPKAEVIHFEPEVLCIHDKIIARQQEQEKAMLEHKDSIIITELHPETTTVEHSSDQQ